MLFYGIKKRYSGAYVYRFNSSQELRKWLKKKCNHFVATAGGYFVKKAKKLLRRAQPQQFHGPLLKRGVKVIDARPIGHR